MIIVDTALKKREAEGRPVRVAMIGAGFMGRGVARQIVKSTPGMELVAIANRTLEKARQAYTDLGLEPKVCTTQSQVDDAIAAGRPVVSEDPLLLARAAGVDVLFEITGSVEEAAKVCLEAIRNGKHVVTMNAELDGTVGPVLKRKADQAGVVFSNSDGDQPGVTLNLFRFVEGLGVKPVLCGNIKGLHDPYRNPTTQEGFARKWGQNPRMVTSFADGTKISFEQAIIANATGMQVGKRGMWGPTVASGTPLKEAIQSLPIDKIAGGPGYVDYLVGPEPGPGVFVLGTHSDPVQQHYLNLYKLGEGPVYLFYAPYHLCHFEAPSSIARAALFQDATIAPQETPRVDVIAAAKQPLKAGQTLDGLGGYDTYGLAENAEVTLAQRLLPMGLSEGCRLRHDLPKDAVITYDDVEIPEGRLADLLRGEQDNLLRSRLSEAA